MLLDRPVGSWLGSSSCPAGGVGMSASMAACVAALAATQAMVTFLPAMLAVGICQSTRGLSPQEALRASG